MLQRLSDLCQISVIVVVFCTVYFAGLPVRFSLLQIRIYSQSLRHVIIAKRQAWTCQANEAKLFAVRTVWSSSQWISESNGSLSSDASSRRQRTRCGCRSGSDRSGWMNDTLCTTSRLWTTPHMSRGTRRCPDHECWTLHHYGLSSNHLQTTRNSPVYFITQSIKSKSYSDMSQANQRRVLAQLGWVFTFTFTVSNVKQFCL